MPSLDLYVLRKEAKSWRKINARVTFRLIALIELRKRQARRVRWRDLDYESVGARLGISGRTLRRWRHTYLSRGAPGLQSRPIPGRPAHALRGWTVRMILDWRARYGWGAEVIQAHLLHDHQIKLSRFRIERVLRRHQLLKRVRRKKKSKHTRKVRIEVPGQFTQMDVKYFMRALKDGSRVYVYSLVDHASKWRHRRAFSMVGNLQTKEFLEEALRLAPFKIQCIQTDNGAEFTNRFNSHPDDPKPHLVDEICARHGIRHKLIPPGEKELQGLVERSHRQDDEELYHRIRGEPHTLAGLNSVLDSHTRWSNASRRRKSLGWQSANQWLTHHFKNLASQAELEKTDNPEESLLKAA
jgi:hypothetical protein